MEQLVFSPGMNISENLSREIICLVAIDHGGFDLRFVVRSRIAHALDMPAVFNGCQIVGRQVVGGERRQEYALLRNNGADGITTVQAKANGEVVAEKIMTVEGGSWRVVQMDLTLDAAEYTIEVGNITIVE